ncbi:MAG: hypothetical protein IAA16_09295 [Candidatus Treponema excrementipullorum]|uniref:Uncharacterized protein n=1 Tax=Candidatus Treponema excrementipullorum TaxID=2838768 RepID=A0A9E2L388_9SPIR|nr:hypothetical protein [Candidatus Treponema excrementipullorum]
MKTILLSIALLISFIPFCVSIYLSISEYQTSSEKNNLEDEISKYEQCQELRALTQEGEQISQELKQTEQTEQKIKQILISIVLIIVSAIMVFGMFSWCDSWFDPLE